MRPTLTSDDVEGVIRNFTFRGGLSLWRPELRLHAWLPEYWSFVLQARIKVPRVQDDEPGEIIFSLDVPLVGMGKDSLPTEIMRRLRDVVEHEFRESVLYEGEPLENPHPRGPSLL